MGFYLLNYYRHNLAIDFIPWSGLREALVIHQDNISIDDILKNLLQRVCARNH